MLRAYSTILLLAAGLFQVQAAEFKSIATKDGKIIVSLSGEIAEGDDATLKAQIKRANDSGKVVSGIRLNSPGGSVAEAVRLAETIRNARTATLVASGARCASACFIAFAAGNEKFVNYSGLVGVHGAANREGRETVESSAVTVAMGRIVKELGVPPTVIGKMVTTPPDEMVWLSDNDLRAMGATMVGKPSQTAAPNPATNAATLNQLSPRPSESGEPLALTPPPPKQSTVSSWKEVVDKAMAASSAQNRGTPKVNRVCQPQLKICNIAIFFKANDGSEMMVRVTENIEGRIIKRDMCFFNDFEDVRTCMNWDSKQVTRSMKNARGEWEGVD